MKVNSKTILFYLFTAMLLVACGANNGASENATTSMQDTVPPIAPKEDTFITRLRPVLFALQNQELSFSGHKPFDVTISDIGYTFISMNAYYAEQEKALAAQVKYSTDKEKTANALRYLHKMAGITTSEKLYKVQFHLKAKVDKTVYDQPKILYLKKDLTLFELIFP